jgi:hypothetical protein
MSDTIPLTKVNVKSDIQIVRQHLYTFKKHTEKAYRKKISARVKFYSNGMYVKMKT